MRTLFPRLRSLLLLLTLLTGCGQALPTPEVPQASASQAQQAVYTTPVTPSTKASLEKETELLPTTPRRSAGRSEDCRLRDTGKKERQSRY